jgi:hypothetical protein
MRELRMLGLEGDELAIELVVLGVGHRGVVEHVVAIRVRLDLAYQLIVPRAQVCLSGHAARLDQPLPGIFKVTM